MWIKRFPILWVKLKFSEQKPFSITIPVPFYVLQELLLCLQDLADLLCFFTPKRLPSRLSTAPNISSILDLIEITEKLLDSLTDYEPYELVDVTTPKVKVSVKIS